MSESIQESSLQKAVDTIQRNRKFSPKSQQGAVMLTCRSQSIQFDGIKIYYAKNPKHFWLGKVDKPHITLHHGFELQRYEEDGSGEAGFTADIKSILEALDKDEKSKGNAHHSSFKERLFNGTLHAKPSYFPPNPALLGNGEGIYYTVILEAEPTPEMVTFRQALLKVFPHTTQFPKWRPHITVATVSTEESKDLLMKRLQHNSLSVNGLFVGYNIIQKYSTGSDAN